MKQICRRLTVCGAARIDNGNNSPSPWHCCQYGVLNHIPVDCPPGRARGSCFLRWPCPFSCSAAGRCLVWLVEATALGASPEEMAEAGGELALPRRGPIFPMKQCEEGSGAVSCCARIKEASLVAVKHFSHYPLLLQSRLLLARKCYLDLPPPFLWSIWKFWWITA